MATKKKTLTKSSDVKPATGKIGFEVVTKMRAPLKKVWEAATQAKHLEKFFVHKVKGDFNARFEPLFWTWPSHGTFPLYPVAYAKEKFLEFYWPLHGSKGKLSLVRFEFEAKQGVVTLKISESGWTQKGLPYAFENCQGWTEFMSYLQAYVMWKKDMRTQR